jgi:tRNA (guanine37-N1)-methyltransferase
VEYPHYTRPGSYRDWQVPEVLLSGHHREIETWRRKESLKRTYLRRPDLLEKIKLSEEDRKILEEIKKNN